MKEAYAQGLESEEDKDSVGDKIKPKDVGHNIYILAHQVLQMPELFFSVTEALLHFLCLSDLVPTSGLCAAPVDVRASTCVLLFECVLCAK